MTTEQTSGDSSPLIIDYFSDVLCIWAYGAEVRINQLRKEFDRQIEIHYRLISLFGDTRERIARGWEDRGGYAGFNQYQQEIAAVWNHVDLCKTIWLEDPPVSSLMPHLYLKAAQKYLEKYQPEALQNGVFGSLVWNVRQRFFAQGENVCKHQTLINIFSAAGISEQDIRTQMENGEAHAALHMDMESKEVYQVTGSPTLVFNEGRQKLYGNVGYRIIEANIRELLRNSQSGEASWC